MKKKNIRHLGIKYSAYSDRGRQIKLWKLRHKVETTVKAVSILLATSLTTLKTVHYA